MFSKIFILIFFTISFFQYSKSDQTYEKILNGTFNIVESQFAFSTRDIERNVEFVITKIELVGVEQNTTALNELDRLITSHKKIIENLIVKTNDTGVDINDCLHYTDERFNQTSENLQRSFKEAIENKVDEVRKKAEEAFKTFDGYRKIFTDYQKEADSCSDFDCFMIIYQKTTNASSDAAGKAYKFTVDMGNYSQLADLEFLYQLDEVKNIYFEDAENVKNEIIGCIQNKTSKS